MQNITEAFKNKVLVITGGTGSFGSTVLKHFLTSGLDETYIAGSISGVRIKGSVLRW